MGYANYQMHEATWLTLVKQEKRLKKYTKNSEVHSTLSNISLHPKQNKKHSHPSLLTGHSPRPPMPEGRDNQLRRHRHFRQPTIVNQPNSNVNPLFFFTLYPKLLPISPPINNNNQSAFRSRENESETNNIKTKKRQKKLSPKIPDPL